MPNGVGFSVHISHANFRAIRMSWIDHQSLVTRLDDAIHRLDRNDANEWLIPEHIGVRGAAPVREIDPDRRNHWNINARSSRSLDPRRIHFRGVEPEPPLSTNACTSTHAPVKVFVSLKLA
jgi:hypothetical protein